jgi:hypothetical protein
MIAMAHARPANSRNDAMNHLAAAGHLPAIVTAAGANLARSRRAAEVTVTVTPKAGGGDVPLCRAAAGP